MLSATSSLAEPQEILNQTTQTFEDARAADPQVIAALGEKLQKLEQQRRKWTDDANEKIRALTYRVELARARSQRPASAPSAEDHSQLLARLKGELLAAEQRAEEQERLMKEAEDRLRKANDEEEILRAEREEEEARGGETVDPVVLQLEIYRALGMELLARDPAPGTEPDASDPIVFPRALIKSKTALTSVELTEKADPAEAFAEVNRLWRLMY